jgi:DNA-binding NarL/FixJ family response regulator
MTPLEKASLGRWPSVPKQAELPGLAKAQAPNKRVLVVDDHPMMRVGLVQIVNQQPGIEVCGEAGSPAEAMAQLAGGRPDLILADLAMKGGSGLEFIKDIRALHGDILILVVSMHDEALFAERSLKAGARGYIMKEESGEHLVAAIRRVLAGGTYLSAQMSERLIRRAAAGTPRGSTSPLGVLSDREFEVFQHIGQGKTTREIAEHLHLSTKTIDTHRAKIRQKLEMHSAAALLRYAVQWITGQGKCL